ncbi:MAG TPA: hypothetical protein DCS89_15345, partial [Gammaproteobacteria bacterium]|nr:hypothetical protein [Gammaproteobacteria bacterium]
KRGGCELGGYWAYLRGSKWRYKSDATLLKDLRPAGQRIAALSYLPKQTTVERQQKFMGMYLDMYSEI